MVDDILDKIVVPDVKNRKGDVFKEKKEKILDLKKKKNDEKKERDIKRIEPKHEIHEKKEIFKKGEFDTRKPVFFNIKAPGLIERGTYIIIILILFYFAFFRNININLDFGDFFEDVQPLVVKSTETEKNETVKQEAIKTETTEETKIQISGEIILTIDNVKTEKYETGISKINGFTFTIDNQKEEFNAKIKYYAYDSSTPAMWNTKERGESTYIIPIGKTTKTIDTKIIFSTSSTKTMRFELYDNEKTIANITKEVTIS